MIESQAGGKLLSVLNRRTSLMEQLTGIFSMFRLVAIAALAGSLFFFADAQQASAQYVTTYYTPAPAVGVIPVRRGLFGLRTGYVPVVTGTVPVPVTTMYAPAPVTTMYAPAPVTTMYAPAPVMAAPVTTYYAPAPIMAAPVTTYYAPAPVSVRAYYTPTIYVGR